VHGLGGSAQIDPRGIILGFVPIPNNDLATTNFAFGDPDNQCIYFEGVSSGTFWRFKAPYPGLIGPGGVRPAGATLIFQTGGGDEADKEIEQDNQGQ
jgi:gluconolactonase